MTFVGINLMVLLMYVTTFKAKASVPVCELIPPEITLPNADNNSITVQWTQPVAEDGHRVCNQQDAGTFYEIRYWRVNRNKTASINVVSSTQNRHKLLVLKSRKYYSVQMRFSQRTGMSDEARYSQWSETLTHGAVDGVPDEPQDLTAPGDERQESSICVSWNPPANPNGHILNYMIAFKMKSSDDNAQIRSLSVNATSVKLSHLEKGTSYIIWVTARTRLGTGSPTTLIADTKSDSKRIQLAIEISATLAVVIFIAAAIFIGKRFKTPQKENLNTGEVPQRIRYGSVLRTTEHAENEILTGESAWTITIKQLTFGKELTKRAGHFQIRQGKLMNPRGQNKTTSVVVKTCGVAADVETRRKLKNESEILQLIGERANIVQLLGICENEGAIHEVLEYCPTGSLNCYLRDNSSKLVDASELLLGMAIAVAHGMQYIAHCKILHRDLATENILIGSSNIVKISGFGYATVPGKTPLPIPELSNWRSKSIESLLCMNAYTAKSDVWSFGVVLWELLAPGNTPYVEMSLKETKSYLSLRKRLPKQKHWHDSIYDVMLQCWSTVPNNRPSFEHLESTLATIKDKKQFYHNFMADDVLYDSVNVEEYDLVNSGEFEGYQYED